MRRGLLLKAMILKEIRCGLRERQQLIGIIVMVIVLVSLSGVMVSRFREMTSSIPAARTTLPAARVSTHAPMSPVMLAAARWGAVFAGLGIGFFFSLGHLLASALATFAGEKDNGTLEVLLASPVHDTTLFLLKCLSVLLPSSLLGYLFLLVPTTVALWLLRHDLASAPFSVAFYLLVASVPLVLLVNLILVATAAAVSAKTDSLKGASQVFGAIIFVLIFGMSFLLPMVFRWLGIRHWGGVKAITGSWLAQAFWLQYIGMLSLLAGIAVIALVIGRALFRRDRLVG